MFLDKFMRVIFSGKKNFESYIFSLAPLMKGEEEEEGELLSWQQTLYLAYSNHEYEMIFCFAYLAKYFALEGF